MDFFTIADKVWKDQPITDAELEVLLRWLMSSDGRRQFEQEIERKWREYRSDRRIDYDGMLQKIHSRKNIRAKSRRTQLIRRTSRIAAVVFVAVAAGALLLIQGEQPHPINTTYDGVFGSGNMAVLTLADGRRVPINEYLDSEIEEGGAVVKIGEGELRYESNDAAEGVFYHEITIPVGGEYKLTLNDGTHVWLNSESRLRYPNRFSSPERRVTLSGEAYFKVSPDRDCPFVVETEGQQITVLGTEFNIAAYPADNRVLTTLAEGSVSVTSSGGEGAVLTPGQQADLDKASGVIAVREVDIEQVAAWRDGYFVVEDQTLEQVMQKLARWYGIEYRIGTDVPRDIIFRGVIPKYDIDNTLKKIEMICNLKLKLDGNTVTVKK